jgi:hypothetical protein
MAFPEPIRSGTPGYHDSYDFVAQDQRKLGTRQLSVDNVQVGPADAAGMNSDQNLARTGSWQVKLVRPQRPAGPLQHHCVHPVG